MNVRHDRSYISENSRDLIGRGYAAEVLDTLHAGGARCEQKPCPNTAVCGRDR